MLLTLIIVLLSLLFVIQGTYYLIFKKEKMKKWGLPMKLLFYFGFVLCSIIVTWEIAATTFKHLS